MTADHDRALLLDALAWQIELGVDEAISDEPIDRLTPAPAQQAVEPAAQAAQPQSSDPSDLAREIAARATTLEDLHRAMADFDGCALKKGARNTVFADGNPAARVMIVGEAPGRDEDLEGRPFVGRSGQLLDRMLAAIGLSRTAEAADRAVYITNVLPWRPPQNRDPATDEVAMMRAFLERHIALKAPEILVTMGNAATKTLLETQTGITRLRGRWSDYEGVPLLPMFHPAALLRNPIQKRDAWSDLLSLKARMNEGKPE